MTDDEIVDAALARGLVDVADEAGLATKGVDTGEVFPPPGQPMPVARQLEPDWIHDGSYTLRRWRNTWMAWRRSHWSETDDQAVKADLYRRLEHGRYKVENSKGEIEIKPWAPTKVKIANLADALGAITHLGRDVQAPSWTDNRDEGIVVACRNGLLRVDDRKLLDHDPRFFNLVSVPFDYEPDAGEPHAWLAFLRDVWTDENGRIDLASIDALQEFFGYVISGRTDLQKMLLIVGPTRSGKGTIGRVITALVGKGNMAGPTLASMATNFGLSPLLGKPLAIISDARLGGGGSQVVERLLTITGEDTIDVDRKFQDPWTGRLPTRFLILSNELPSFGDASGTIAHRFIVLQMQNSWLGRENTALGDQIAAELPGILNWALDGLARLVERGRFEEPASSVEAVIAMKDSASPMSAFVRECCDIGAGREISVDDIFQAWRNWCEDNGRDRAGNKQMFGRNLQAVVPSARLTRPRDDEGARVRIYQGITIKPQMISLVRVGPRPNPLQSYSTRDEGSTFVAPALNSSHNALGRGPSRTTAPEPAPIPDSVASLNGSDGGECCGVRADFKGERQPRCKVCPKSPNYWRNGRPAFVYVADPADNQPAF